MAMASDALVELRGITKVYGRGAATIEALRTVDLDVRPGEFVGVMGPSGCGKSTLLHIVGCLDPPTSGAYRLALQDVSSLPEKELARIRATRIGFVFQSFNVIPQYSILENVAMPFLYQDRYVPDALERAERVLDRVGLSARCSHKPAELSGGEIQRAAIARALVIEPLLILADEPTGNLDSKTSEGVLDLFRELHERGVTLIVVTHDPHVASRCERIVHLADGRVVPGETAV
jgi:putative ABC transport system ATP-binding protein